MNKRWRFFHFARQDWIVSGDDKYLDALLHTRGGSDEVLDAWVLKLLRRQRLRRAAEPWRLLLVEPVLILWRHAYGRYRRAREKVRGGPASQPGGGAGAGSFSSPTAYAVHAAAVPFTVAAAASGSFEDAGIRAGEVTAYRCWLLKDGKLHSAYQNSFVWEPGQTAEGDPTQPNQGVHGFKSRLNACQYIDSYEGQDHTGASSIVVSGTVLLWDSVYEHQRGYRASKACIASIDDSPNYDAAALRKLYQLNRRRKKPK